MDAGNSIRPVALQGSYVARRCPVAAQLEVDDSLEVTQEPLAEAEQTRVDGGRAFEQEMFDRFPGIRGNKEFVAILLDTLKMDRPLYQALHAFTVKEGWPR